MRKRRILVVEDMAVVRESFSMILEASGYRVVQAANAHQAIEILQHAIMPFDLILLDYRMPGMNGIEFLRVVRCNPDWAELPVIMLTEVAAKEIVVEAADLGVNSYFLKSSFNLAKLSQVVQEEIASGKVQTENLKIRPPEDAGTKAHLAAANLNLLPKIPRSKSVHALTDYAAARAMSGVVAEVIALVSSPDSTPLQLAAAIKQDPVITARILRVANSAQFAPAYGGSSSIEDAVARIGSEMIRYLSVSIGLLDVPLGDGRSTVDSVRKWQHCFVNARIMERMLSNTPSRDAGYLIGLGHGLIQLLLDQNFPREFAAALLYSKTHDQPLYEALPVVFGASIAELFSEAMAGFKLPPAIQNSIDALFNTSGVADLQKIESTLRFLEHFWSSLCLEPGHIAPFSKADRDLVFGGVRLPDIDCAELKREVIQSTLTFADLSSDEKERVSRPLFERGMTKVHYVREPQFVDPDPVGITLSSMIEIERTSRLPQSEKELKDCQGVVVLSTDVSINDRSLSAYRALIEAGPAARKLSVLHITSVEPAGREKELDGIEVVKYPFTTSRLARFINNI